MNPDRARPDAWIDRIVSNRLAPWTKQGVIFGVPHDVHPVTLSYRKDLWDEAGIDPEWVRGRRRPRDAAHLAGVPGKSASISSGTGRAAGVQNRHAMELFESQPDMLVCLLLQRHVNVIDEDGDAAPDGPQDRSDLAFYARMVAGAGQVAAESAGGTGPWANDISPGQYLFVSDPRLAAERPAPVCAATWPASCG